MFLFIVPFIIYWILVILVICVRCFIYLLFSFLPTFCQYIYDCFSVTVISPISWISKVLYMKFRFCDLINLVVTWFTSMVGTSTFGFISIKWSRLNRNVSWSTSSISFSNFNGEWTKSKRPGLAKNGVLILNMGFVILVCLYPEVYVCTQRGDETLLFFQLEFNGCLQCTSSSVHATQMHWGILFYWNTFSNWI